MHANINPCDAKGRFCRGGQLDNNDHLDKAHRMANVALSATQHRGLAQVWLERDLMSSSPNQTKRNIYEHSS